MNERHVFFADVHLRKDQLAKRDALLGVLDELARPGVHLYSLGDMFDVWVGPDHVRVEKELAPVLEAIGKFTASGARFTWFHGNRDFYMGRFLSQKMGAETVSESAVIELDGQRVYLNHGDLLCTGDQLYHVAKWFIRGPLIWSIYRTFPLSWKFGMVRAYKNLSQRQVPRRRKKRHGVNPDRVAALIAEGVDVIICGHIHEPRDDVIADGDRGCRLIVLPPWNENGTLTEYIDGDFVTRTVEFA